MGGVIALPGYPFAIPAVAQYVTSWRYVTSRFSTLLENLKITVDQTETGDARHCGVRATLNRHYWNSASETDNSILIGSWGKRTRVRPPRDIDIMFFLPWDVYQRFEQRTGNKQSQLLQEVRQVLGVTYSQTAIRGDGQVVVIPFNSMPVEVVPAFYVNNETVWICDTNDGGRYKVVAPFAELQNVETYDAAYNGNVRALVRMMKQWQRHCNASDLKSFQLELLAIDFLKGWENRERGLFWYDWMVRDFLAYLIGRVHGCVALPVTGELSWLGADWFSRAQTAHRHAMRACEHETKNENWAAGYEWSQIFGAAVPTVAA
jgi:hypothetical protein